MIGISAIGTHVPPLRLSNFERKSEFDMDEDFISAKLGVERVSRKAPDEETSDLCVKAYDDLRSGAAGEPGEVDCLVVCTQNPDARGLPHTSAIVHGKLGLGPGCACFDISLGCSGYVYGLSIMRSFMEANDLKTGLLFTADPYSKILDDKDRNTALLFGDAAAVTLLRSGEPGSPLWQPGPFRFGTRGKDGSALQNVAGKLAMNGRAVFNFSATEVPAQVKALLADARLRPQDVDLFLFHQGSRFIVEQIAKRLGLPPGKVPVEIADHGNTVSSSLPLVLKRRLGESRHRTVVLSGFGVGLSWASCLLTRGTQPRDTESA